MVAHSFLVSAPVPNLLVPLGSGFAWAWLGNWDWIWVWGLGLGLDNNELNTRVNQFLAIYEMMIGTKISFESSISYCGLLFDYT